jgi:ActR/RegA family two-component response regulator
MDGIELPRRGRQVLPDTVRMTIAGLADVDNALAAVNKGHIFRFLAKFCDIETLARALTAGIKQYRLVRMENNFLGRSLKG